MCMFKFSLQEGKYVTDHPPSKWKREQRVIYMYMSNSGSLQSNVTCMCILCRYYIYSRAHVGALGALVHVLHVQCTCRSIRCTYMYTCTCSFCAKCGGRPVIDLYIHTYTYVHVQLL